MKKHLILLMLAAVGVARADDASWSVIASSVSRTIYLQPASVHAHGPATEAWTYYNFNEPQMLGLLSYQSSRHLYDYDCAGRRTTLRQSYYYGGTRLNGAEVKKSDYPKPDWAPVGEAGSVGEIVFRKVCGAKP